MSVNTPAEIVPQREADALVALDEVKRQLSIAKLTGDTETLLEWQRRAAAILHYTRMRDGGRDAANDAGEVKVRAEAALGAIDREANPHGVRSDRRDSPTESLPPEVGSATRANWRKLGALPDDELDERIQDARADEESGVTTTRVLRGESTRAPQRPALSDDFRSAVVDLDRSVARLSRICTDDRLGRNRESLRDAYLHDLHRIHQTVSNCIATLEA